MVKNSLTDPDDQQRQTLLTDVVWLLQLFLQWNFPAIMRSIIKDDLESRYPTPLVCGARISRIGEKYLGPERLDADTCRRLGEDQVGWFVGHMPSFERMIEHVRQINDAEVGGRWIVVPATRLLAQMAHDEWFGDASTNASSATATMWRDRRITFCVPERLADLGKSSQEHTADIAGILLLDPNCIVHCARSFSNEGFWVAHDRPQLIVDFRASQAVGAWAPPLTIMSRHRAGAVPAQRLARAFCLESFHFIEGAGLWSGVMPTRFQKFRAVPDVRTRCVLAPKKETQWDTECEPASAPASSEQAALVPNLAQPA